MEKEQDIGKEIKYLNITNKETSLNNNNESLSIDKGSFYKTNSKISKGEGTSLIGETNDVGSVSFNKDVQAASFRNFKNEDEEGEGDQKESESDHDEEIYTFGPDKGKKESDSSSDEESKEKSKTKIKLKKAGLELIKVFSKELNFKK